MATVDSECKNYQEQITAAVDNVLGESEWEKLEAHLAHCDDCRKEFEVAKLTRSIVKSKCRRMRAPSHMLGRINDELAVVDSSMTHKGSWRARFSSPYFRAGLSCVVVAAAALVFLNTSAARKDVVKQSLANYKAVARGDMKPQLVSNNTNTVLDYFVGKTHFAVVVPIMKDCKLVGGGVNEISGEKLAHVVYSHDDSEIVYLYEASWQTVQDGEDFQLSADIQDELNRSGWYSASDPDGYALVMWTKGNTLCSAVAKMDKETLRACLDSVL